MSTDFERRRELAQQEVETTLAQLPAPLRQEALALAITFEDRPNDAQREEGIQPDTLGLFVGPEFAFEKTSAEPLPPQIMLFLDNLWEMAEGDEAVYREEVRTTLLHELGHYLGLDEDELFYRGLE